MQKHTERRQESNVVACDAVCIVLLNLWVYMLGPAEDNQRLGTQQWKFRGVEHTPRISLICVQLLHVWRLYFCFYGRPGLGSRRRQTADDVADCAPFITGEPIQCRPDTIEYTT